MAVSKKHQDAFRKLLQGPPPKDLGKALRALPKPFPKNHKKRPDFSGTRSDLEMALASLLSSWF